MNLHYVDEVADWEKIGPTARNRWQRLAARTGGWLTPGNLVSVAGLALVLTGVGLIAADHFGTGLVVVGVGRLADVLDGTVAEATRTKSSIGEAVDAGADKLAAAAMLIVILAKGVLPAAAGAIIIVQNLANIVVSYRAKTLGLRMHPNRSGKLSAVWEWLAILLYALAYLRPHTHAWRVGAELALAAFVVFGYTATIKYVREVFLRNSST